MEIDLPGPGEDNDVISVLGQDIFEDFVGFLTGKEQETVEIPFYWPKLITCREPHLEA